MLGGEEEPAFGREEEAPGLDGRRRLFRRQVSAAGRSMGSLDQVRAKPGRASRVLRMISHCCAMVSVLFQLQ